MSAMKLTPPFFFKFPFRKFEILSRLTHIHIASISVKNEDLTLLFS